MLRFTPSKATGMSPFSLITGRTPHLPSLPNRYLPELPASPSRQQEEAYYEAMSRRAEELRTIAGSRILEMERRIREATRRKEKDIVNPTLLFHFEPG